MPSETILDRLSSAVRDPAHSEGKFRLVPIGSTFAGRLIVVSHVARGEAVRLISGRVAMRRERKTYEQEG